MDLIETYLAYKKESEPPYIYHRWSMLTSIGALLGRRYYIQFGDGYIYPNLYVMLIGGVGARKSSAIKSAVKLIKLAGYKTFSARKTSKEKWLMDLEGYNEEENEANFLLGEQDSVTDINLFGGALDVLNLPPKETFIAADEFNEFAVGNPIEFYSLLGDLWDWDDPTLPYTSRIKGSKRGGVSIYQPTINILGGNTPENFSRAFPPEIIGQGFMSRLLIILGEQSPRKYHVPPLHDPKFTDIIIKQLSSILNNDFGLAKLPEPKSSGDKLLQDIYENWSPLDDIRFRYYGTRRYTQLLKLCLIHSAARGTDIIDEEIIILSNTILSAAERNMSKAIGEFGKNKNSDVTNTILTLISETGKPLTLLDIWKAVRKDVDKQTDAARIIDGLKAAELIQYVPGKGYIPKAIKKNNIKHTDWSLLTEEERNML